MIFMNFCCISVLPHQLATLGPCHITTSARVSSIYCAFFHCQLHFICRYFTGFLLLLFLYAFCSFFSFFFAVFSTFLLFWLFRLYLLFWLLLLLFLFLLFLRIAFREMTLFPLVAGSRTTTKQKSDSFSPAACNAWREGGGWRCFLSAVL